jgi:hypothetical protein
MHAHTHSSTTPPIGMPCTMRALHMHAPSGRSRGRRAQPSKDSGKPPPLSVTARHINPAGNEGATDLLGDTLNATTQLALALCLLQTLAELREDLRRAAAKNRRHDAHVTTTTRLRRSSFVAHAPLSHPTKNKSGTSTTQRPCPRAMDIAVPPRDPSMTPNHFPHHTPGDGGWSSSLRCQKSERSAPETT